MLDVLALFPFVKTCTPHHAIARYANHFNSKASHWHVEKSFSNKCRRRFWKRIIQFATEPILEPSTAGDADAEDAARAGAAGAAVAAARGAGGAGGAGGGGGGGGGSVAPPPLQAITPLRVGWLEKRGGLNTNFKRRFFVLWPKLLLYYEVLVRSSRLNVRTAWLSSIKLVRSWFLKLNALPQHTHLVSFGAQSPCGFWRLYGFSAISTPGTQHEPCSFNPGVSKPKGSISLPGLLVLDEVFEV